MPASWYNKAIPSKPPSADRMKEFARSYHHTLPQVLFLKKIEALHITRSMQDIVGRSTDQWSRWRNRKLVMISKLSNLSPSYWYIKTGMPAMQKMRKPLNNFFKQHFLLALKIPKISRKPVICTQSHSWKFIRQDFLMYYRYTQKLGWMGLTRNRSWEK